MKVFSLIFLGLTSESIFRAKGINNKIYEYFENNLSDTGSSFKKFDTQSHLEFLKNDNRLNSPNENLIEYIGDEKQQDILMTNHFNKNQDQNISSQMLKNQNLPKNHSFTHFKSFKEKPKIIKINKKDLKNLDMLVKQTPNKSESLSPPITSFKNFGLIRNSNIYLIK